MADMHNQVAIEASGEAAAAAAEAEKAAAKASASVANPSTTNTAEEIAAKEAEDKAAADKAEAGKKDEFVPKVSDSAAEQVESMLKAAGLDPDKVGANLSADGTLAPAEFLKLTEKYGEGTANLIASQLSGMLADGQARAAANDKAVYDQVAEAFDGVTEQTGEETWKELAGWAQTNVPDAERGEINDMLSMGGIASKLAIKELVSRFQGSDTYTQEARLESADRLANTGTGAGIDKAAYDRELRDLMAKGHDYNSSPEIAALQRKRMKGLKRGQ